MMMTCGRKQIQCDRSGRGECRGWSIVTTERLADAQVEIWWLPAAVGKVLLRGQDGYLVSYNSSDTALRSPPVSCH